MSQRSTLDVFIERTKYHFRFLIDEFAFELTDAGVASYEASVVFENSFLKISITYEGGSPPWCSLYLVQKVGDAVTYVPCGPLDLLLEERGRAIPAPEAPRDLSEDALDAFLAEISENLKTVGRDVLEGNLEPVKRLRTKALDYLARREAQLYRTKPTD